MVCKSRDICAIIDDDNVTKKHHYDKLTTTSVKKKHAIYKTSKNKLESENTTQW